jgi:hypothetical protein
MFRLVKNINGNTQCEVFKINYISSATIVPGCALTCSSGKMSTSTATVFPEYISLGIDEDSSSVNAMVVTEDMIFKVEYIGTTSPLIGMNVGPTNHIAKADAVTYNTSGKGKIVEIGDENFVYVRFRK